MRYLLDTHVVLWCALTPDKLSQEVKEIIIDEHAEKCVSIVSVWEFVIKQNLNKLHLEGGVDSFIQIIDENGFFLLGIEIEYVRQLAGLPLMHHDPFDRMMIATAIAENMHVVTADENIRKYDVPNVW